MHLYLHIPFCNQKCLYCDFVSGVFSKETKANYVKALINELHASFQHIEPRSIKTVYIGGGTPSSLEPDLLISIYEALDQHIDLANLEEFTIEANPESVNFDFALLAAANHVNRISLGVQSANDEELSFLGRLHNFEEVEKTVKIFHQVGIHNINLDLIFALPEQGMKSLAYSLKKFTDLQPEHISCYSLIYEDGTPMTKLLETGMISELDDNHYIKQYRFIIDYLQGKGYQQYEISNFAKKGCESKHNSAYWTGADYLGLGAAAHSKIANKRFSNVTDIQDYIKRGNSSSEFLQAIDEESIENLDAKDIFNEFIFLGLRMNQGLSLADLSYHIDQLKQSNQIPNQADHERISRGVYAEIEKMIEEGFLQLKDKKISLTQEGREVSNSVFSRLII